MTKYAVFLRGINVGGRVIEMAELQACFEAAGLQNVSTLLQSGNVVFETGTGAAELKPLIESKLTAAFHYPAKAQIYTIDELRGIVATYPFGTASDAQHDYVIFIENGLEKDLVNETYSLAAGEQVKVGTGVVYWRVDRGSTLKSSFAKLLTKAKYRDFNTNRNIKTLRKVLAI